MKKTSSFKIKEFISITDKVSAICEIVNSAFTKNEQDIPLYTPYFIEIAKVNVWIDYFTEGLEFEKEESHYEALCADKELYSLYLKFINEDYFDIINHGEDIIAYQKQIQIHNQKSALEDLFVELTGLVSEIKRELKDGDFSDLMDETNLKYIQEKMKNV